MCDFRGQGLTESFWQTFVSFPRAGAHRELLADICVTSAGRGSQAAPGMYLCRLPACRPIEEPRVPFPPVWRTGPHQGVIRALPAGLADRIPRPVSRTDLGDHVREIKARTHLNFWELNFKKIQAIKIICILFFNYAHTLGLSRLCACHHPYWCIVLLISSIFKLQNSTLLSDF